MGKKLDNHLTKNGYVCNNVDKAFYIYHQQNNLVAMLSITVDNLLSFRTKSIRDKFFTFMGKVFDITTPGYQQELTVLSLKIYQSLYSISVDQTQHIYINILLEWFKEDNCFK